MTAAQIQVTTPSDREIAVACTFTAPRALVFDALTQPHLVKQWLLGPPGWTMPVCEIDARVQGRYRYEWINATGEKMGMGGVYTACIAPELIVATEKFDQPWYEGEAEARIELTERDGKTHQITTVRYASKAVRDGVLQGPMTSGMAISYDRLDELLAGLQGNELMLTRIINAPRDKLFRAFTEPALLVQWFTLEPWRAVHAEIDARPGGSSLVVMRSPDGREFLNRDVYLDVVRNERIVFTDAFASAWTPSDKAFMVVILNFEDIGDGQTRYTARVRHWTAEDREAHEKMGFHHRWGKATDQLAALAAKI
jgi:uncharacterized protein YndB with AHSA1/START domain